MQWFVKTINCYLISNTSCYREVWRRFQIRNHYWTIPLNQRHYHRTDISIPRESSKFSDKRDWIEENILVEREKDITCIILCKNMSLRCRIIAIRRQPMNTLCVWTNMNHRAISLSTGYIIIMSGLIKYWMLYIHLFSPPHPHPGPPPPYRPSPTPLTVLELRRVSRKLSDEKWYYCTSNYVRTVNNLMKKVLLFMSPLW